MNIIVSTKLQFWSFLTKLDGLNFSKIAKQIFFLSKLTKDVQLLRLELMDVINELLKRTCDHLSGLMVRNSFGLILRCLRLTLVASVSATVT